MTNQGKVYFKNIHAGNITKEIDGSYTFQYKNNTAPSVSLTLPTHTEIYKAEDLFPFFDGLIPEGWLLNLAQKNWKIPKNDRMTLLLTTCHDCIGASSVQTTDKLNAYINPVLKKNEQPTIKHQSDRCMICLQDLDSKNDLYHAKCATRLFGFAHTPFIDVHQADLENLALQQINQRLTLTGVQKKLSLSPLKENDTSKASQVRLTIVGLDGRFILKPANDEFPEMPAVEQLSMKIAELHGLKMAQCGLVYLASGELAYITKRFDRIDNQKIQMEDFCQLSRLMTEKKYNGSSEKMGKVIDEFSSAPGDDKVTLFQTLLFSFWIGNADMHLKNFSLWKDPDTNLIRLSPGYDHLSTRLLISSKEDSEELALPLNGKKNKLRWHDFEALTASFKIPSKVASHLKTKMLSLMPQTQDLINRSFLEKKTKEALISLITERSHRLS